MRLLQLLLIFALLLATTGGTYAVEPVSGDHSSVHIVFVIPNATPPHFDSSAPTARVGDIIMPVESVRPIAVTIDEEFVGHAMVGYQDVKPVFVLPSGSHEFKFTCDGYKASSIKMNSLGAGSKQYLVVKMEPSSQNTTDKPDQESSGASAAKGPKG